MEKQNKRLTQKYTPQEKRTQASQPKTQRPVEKETSLADILQANQLYDEEQKGPKKSVGRVPRANRSPGR